MKVKARKLLSLALSLAMVMGMLVLPASAALAEGNAEDGVYVLDFSTDYTRGSSDITIADNNTTPIGTDNYFVVSGLKIQNKDSKSPTVGTGTEEYYMAVPAQRANTQGATGTNNGTFRRYVKITTKNKNALVKIWWYTGSASRHVAIYGSTDTSDVLFTSTKGTTAANGGAEGCYDTYTVSNAGTTVYIGADASIYFYRIEVVDKDTEPGITLPETAVVAPSGTVTLTATVKNANGAAIAWSSSDTGVATVDSNGVVTAVAASGSTTITAKITVDSKEYSDTCVVTVSSHTHVWAEDKTDSDYKEPTCTEDGLKVEICTGSGTCPDNNKKTTVIEKLGHNKAEDATAVADVAATCTKTGLTGKKICGRLNGDETCQEVVVPGTVVNRLGHNFDADGACTRDGCNVQAAATLEFDFQIANDAAFAGDLGYFLEFAGISSSNDSKYKATIDGTNYGGNRLKMNSSGKLTFKAPGEGTLTAYICPVDGSTTASKCKIGGVEKTLTVADGDTNGMKVSVDTTRNQEVQFERVSSGTYGVYKLVWTAKETEPTKYAVTVTGGTTDKATAAKGESVKITAGAAPEGKVFDKWTATGITLSAADAVKNPLTFTMPEAAVSFTATYKAATITPGPDDPTPGQVVVTDVSLNTNELNLYSDDEPVTLTATVTVTPDTAENKAVTWTSSDDTVATVTDGVVTPVAAGTAIITVKSVKDETKSDSCTVKVEAVSGPTTVIKVLDANDLDEVKKADAVNLNGEKWGTDDFYTVCSVEASKPFVPTVEETSFDGKTWTKTITMGGAFSYNGGNPKAALKFETSNAATVKVWWANASDSQVRNLAVYGSDGALVKASDASKEGATVVQNVFEYNLEAAGTYYLGSNNSSINIYRVEVTETSGGTVKVTGVTLDKPTASVAEGGTVKLTATITPPNATNKDVTWKSSNVAVATVAADGTVTAVKAGTATITVTTANGGKTATCAVTVTASGSETPSTPSGGGDMVPNTSGGGSTVSNPDGSKTTTKTNSSTGAVTETTTYPDGSKTVVVTETDGTVTETVTKKDGSKTETVSKPDGSSSIAVTEPNGVKTETATSAAGDTTAKVTLPKNVDKTIVNIPVKDVTDGTVAVIVKADGTEQVIKTSVAGEAGLELLVDKSVSVKIKDNAKKFDDIEDGYWAKGAVDFASSREIFKGVTETTFAPTDVVNRGMMATVLYRLADAKAEGENVFFDVADGNWYTDAVTWANRSGVVTGYADGTFGPADAVTREQMAAMLFRFAKVIGMDVAAKGDMSKFSDANDVSSWASEAMAWAVGVGLVNGVGDPAQGAILAPAKTASRAEVATLMQRMVKLMMQ